MLLIVVFNKGNNVIIIGILEGKSIGFFFGFRRIILLFFISMFGRFLKFVFYKVIVCKYF